MYEGHSGRPQFWDWGLPFLFTPKIDKTFEDFENKMKKNGQG